ncbi:Zinc finger protein 57 [Eumeta japonica]|uniref:Zinc finger protein 57 n=1 Tax=Eumeta variegata TaxID=151549 RepID=A0A4C1TB47_EUMVA|nr:Zinc finger protein 57 [Eumeta japonica]
MDRERQNLSSSRVQGMLWSRGVQHGAAHIRNALKFKKRVNLATRLLRNLCREEVSAKHSLSPLKINEASHFDVGIEGSLNIQTLVTVKVEYEDRSSVVDDSEDLYASNILYNDIDQEIDTKLVEIPPEENVLKSKRVTRNKKSKTVDSDDEPLKSKTKTPESDSDDIYSPEKGKKQKKKKSKEVKEKIDRRKHPRAKKEKPGGVVNNNRVKKKLEELNVDSSKVEMVLLTWEEVEEERQKALNSITFTRHDYRCYDCVIGFNHKFKLENHMKKHEESVRCVECVAVTRTPSRRTVGGTGYAGDVLAAALLALAQPSQQIMRRERITPPRQRTRASHVGTQRGEWYSGKAEDSPEEPHGEAEVRALREEFQRQKLSQDSSFEYSCPKCDKKFLFKKAMEVHLVTHEAPAGLYCHECDMNFKNQMSYYQHMKYNLKHIDPAKLKFACQLCDKRFVKASRLEEHHVAVHLKATPVRCTMPGCDFACSSRPVLRTHIRMLHRNLRAVRNHVCDACGKAYTTKKTLEGHMRTHTGERPFHCQLCPSTFGYEAALYNHNKLVHLKNKSARRAHTAMAPQQEPNMAAWNAETA